MRRALAFVCFVAAVLEAQPAHLEFAEPVRLVSCEPVSTRPCFRMKLNLVDANGAPYGAGMPATAALASAIRARVGNEEQTPFYAAVAGETTAKARRRAALVLVDISGSMNIKLPSGETRFEAARNAVRVFLQGFEEGADRVAVAPFESHDVQRRIAAVTFAQTRADALAQVDRLPAPAPRNNTAIYSAVVFGLESLTGAVAAMQSPDVESMVILLTDGANDIRRGDDVGLLAGQAGLAQAEKAAAASAIPVIGVGFGDAASIDDAALKRISRKYYAATDARALQQIFAFTRTLLHNRITAVVSAPAADRASLAGRSISFQATLKLPGGAVLESQPQIWTAPQIGVPVYSGRCVTDELRAAIHSRDGGGWQPIVRAAAVFCGLGLLLVILWFGAPRLIWPEQYIGAMPGAGNARWGLTSVRVKDGVIAGRPAPPGFESGPNGVKMPPRGAADPTVLNPGASLGSTRLGNRDAVQPRSR